MPLPTAHSVPQQCRWLSYDTPETLAQAASQAILDAAQQAIGLRGAFRIVLAGGNSPRLVYEMLRKADAPWAAWQVYMGDERCLPPEHAERNSRMAAQAWLDHVAIPASQLHFIPAEMGADAAAASYNRTLRGTGMFDLVLLGFGEDGHTASLFPGHEWGCAADAPDALAVHDAPKPPPDRVTLSAHRLGMARQVMFLVTGVSKRQAVSNWLNQTDIPATAIRPENGVDIYIEAGLLESARAPG